MFFLYVFQCNFLTVSNDESRNAGLSFESVYEILLCDHSNESYRAVYYALCHAIRIQTIRVQGNRCIFDVVVPNLPLKFGYNTALRLFYYRRNLESGACTVFLRQSLKCCFAICLSPSKRNFSLVFNFEDFNTFYSFY